MSVIKVFHFHNGGGGGVLSVIKNLLKYSARKDLENHVIFTINRDLVSHYTMPEIEGAVTQQVFYYSAKWNFYYSCKQLAKLLPDPESLVIAHDWLELGMMSNLGLQNPAVQIVHGNYDYYYELAQKNAEAIDGFICVSPAIFKNLVKLLPKRESDIRYCRFPVPAIKSVEKENQVLKLFYGVRSLVDNNKQFHLLPKINGVLKDKALAVHWTIVGNDIERDEVEKIMGQFENMSVHSSLTNEEVLHLLPEHDLFILPSLKEGFPVAMVEAMKAGLVPLVTNWEGATEELVLQGETGFYVETGNANGYAETLQLLNEDRAMLKSMSKAAVRKANELFDPVINTKLMEELFVESIEKRIREKKAVKVYGSRLDEQWIPNGLVKLIRQVTLEKN